MVLFIALTLGVLASVVLNLISADSLQFLYTEITPGTPFPEFTTIGLVNEQQVIYYDSNKTTMSPRMDCVNKIRDDDPGSWNEETGRVQWAHSDLKKKLNEAMKNHNHTTGIHTVQWFYSCEWNNGSITSVIDRYSYDGVDFIIHDVESPDKTAANDKAVITKNEWDAGVDYPYISKNYLKKECIKWLKKYMSNCSETLERKVPPEPSVFRKFSCSPELLCHATGFFPKGLNITWQKDGEDLIEDVELRETLPNQDGSFQKRSILKVSPEDLQKHEYTCVIKHSSLKEDLVLKARERRILNNDPRIGCNWHTNGRIKLVTPVVILLVFLLVVGFLYRRFRVTNPVRSSDDLNSDVVLLDGSSDHATYGSGDATCQTHVEVEAQSMLDEESGPL